jgi:uncharacterized protein YoxC
VIPTWAAVLGAVSLAIIAISCLVVAAAVTAGVFGLRAFLRSVQQFVAPAVADVRHLIGTIRAEAESLTETSRDLRGRIVHAADAAEARLASLGEVLDTVQSEATAAAEDVAATSRTVRRGLSVWRLGRGALRRRRRTDGSAEPAPEPDPEEE